jgi:hypothetical protein
MIEKAEALSIAESLKPHDVKALNRLAIAGSAFEQAKALIGIQLPMIEYLISKGLAEEGIANTTLGTVGYRLSAKGHAVRAALPFRRPKPGIRLAVMPPRLKPPPPRF